MSSSCRADRGWSCDRGHPVEEKEKKRTKKHGDQQSCNARKLWATDQFTANTRIELFYGTFVRICCYCVVRGFVGSAIKSIDRLCKAELRRRHGCMRGGGSARCTLIEAGKARKHTAHGIQVCLPILLKSAAFLLKSIHAAETTRPRPWKRARTLCTSPPRTRSLGLLYALSGQFFGGANEV